MVIPHREQEWSRSSFRHPVLLLLGVTLILGMVVLIGYFMGNVEKSLVTGAAAGSASLSVPEIPPETPSKPAEVQPEPMDAPAQAVEPDLEEAEQGDSSPQPVAEIQNQEISPTSELAVSLVPSPSTISAHTEGNASQCGVVNRSFTMTANLTVALNGSDACFRVNASNVVIDGAGYYLIGNGSGMGINISGTSLLTNVTAKNFGGIWNFTIGVTAYQSQTYYAGHAIYNNSIITSNVSGGYGVYVPSGASGLNITGNTILLNGSSSTGVYLAVWAIVSSNNITSFYSESPAILLLSKNSEIYSNILKTYGGSSRGVYVSYDNNTIYLNNITTSGSMSSGIHTFNSSLNNISFNIISTYSTRSPDLVLEIGRNNKVSGNTMNTSGGTNSYSVLINSTSILNASHIVQSNTLVTTGSTSQVIRLTNLGNISILYNTILADYTASQSEGISLFFSNYNNISFNNITTRSSLSEGLEFTGTLMTKNWVSYNIIITYSTGHGIVLGGVDSGNPPNSNTFLNNNVTAILRKSYEILDYTGDSSANAMIFSNSFGEMRWVDTGEGTKAFLRNLSIQANVSTDQGFGLGLNVFIGNATAALNLSAFNGSNDSSVVRINSSVILNFTDLHFEILGDIYSVDNFTTNGTEIFASGTNCTGTTCAPIKLFRGVLGINVSSLNSITANGTEDGAVPIISSNAAINSTTGNNSRHVRLNVTITDDGSVDEVRFFVQPFGNLTASKNSDEYFIICGPGHPCNTAIVAGQFNWTSIWVNDTVSSMSAAAVDLQFNTSPIACGTRLEGRIVYELTSDLAGCASNGIIINESNVVFDCHGQTISSSTGTGEGIRISNVPDNQRNGNTVMNVTVRNCRIDKFRIGINMTATNASWIVNNTIYNSTYIGIRIDYGFADDGQAFPDPLGSSHNRIINNTIARTNSSIAINRDTAGVIDSIYPAGIAIGYTYSPYSYSKSESNYNNSLIDNNVSYNFPMGISLGGYNNTIRNNKVQHNHIGYEIGAYQLVGPRFANISLGSLVNNTYAVFMNDSLASASSMVRNYYLRNVHSESNFYDVFANDVATSVDDIVRIHVVNGTVNRTNLSTDDTAIVYVRWNGNFNVTNGSETPIENATLETYDSTGSVDFSIATSSTGEARIEMSEYYHQNRINYIITPTTIKVYKKNHTENITTVNLEEIHDAQFNITIDELHCGSTFRKDAKMIRNDYVCQDEGFAFGADGIILEGKMTNQTSYFLGAETSSPGDGITIINRSNVHVRNLALTGYARALYLGGTNYSNFTDLTFIADNTSIVFNNSHNNYLISTRLFNRSGVEVVAFSSYPTNNTLLNTTTSDMGANVSVSGNATIYRKYYLIINVSMNEGNFPLQSAVVNVTTASDGAVELVGTTSNDGMIKLALAEAVKNSTDIRYPSPHVINVSFSYRGVTYTNSSTFNISKVTAANNTVHLHLNVNCTAPSTDLRILNSTTFCPGTYNAWNISIERSHLTITCPGTTIDSLDGQVYYRDNSNSNNIDKVVPISGTTFSDFNYLIQFNDLTNVTIQGCRFLNSGKIPNYHPLLLRDNVSNSTFYNNTFALPAEPLYNKQGTTLGWSYGYGIFCQNSVGINVTRNSFAGYEKNGGLLIGTCNSTSIINNTFSDSFWAVELQWQSPSKENLIAYNSFTDSDFHVYGYNFDSKQLELNTTMNVSGNITAQGNKYDDYCGKGKDINNDGYAEALRGY